MEGNRVLSFPKLREGEKKRRFAWVGRNGGVVDESVVWREAQKVGYLRLRRARITSSVCTHFQADGYLSRGGKGQWRPVISGFPFLYAQGIMGNANERGERGGGDEASQHTPFLLLLLLLLPCCADSLTTRPCDFWNETPGEIAMYLR